MNTPLTNHDHTHIHCAHANLKYCTHCQVPYCSDCGREWKTHNYPWSPYTNGIGIRFAGNTNQLPGTGIQDVTPTVTCAHTS